MAESPSEFEDQLASLKRAFLDGLPGRIEEIDGIAATIGRDLAAASGRKNTVMLRMLLHKLAGSGGTFGHLAVGDAAAWVEKGCDDILKRDDAPTPAQWRHLESRLEKLRRAADNALANRRKIA